MLAHATPRAAEFIALLKERLPERTVRHSISVADLMQQVAPKAGVDSGAAVTAGLLHDLFKATKGAELLEAARRYRIPISAGHHEKPMLLHGPVAAEEAKHVLGIEDEGVYDAIYWHTTGRANFGKVGLALYFSDFAEPFRAMPESAEARTKLASEGFAAAVRYVAEKKLEHVRKKFTVDPNTAAFDAWLRDAEL